uniref:Nidogen n=1 Tax=Timema douglasi TaxID=61478 RepID=A0A7R8VMY9_TIMDO|nr:unnamed protein product [Timema douglasi]
MTLADTTSHQSAQRGILIRRGFPLSQVNSNGLLSFLTEIPSFFNIQFPLDYPVIAPLYTNVDTRGSGTVYYRETQDPSLLERASDAVRESFSSAADFTATSLFIATWDNVGYYNRGSDKVNTFQVVICSNGDDSYVQFLYADGGIQWIQSTGQSTGLPDARAQAGLMSGDGRLFTLRGSGTDQIQNLDKSVRLPIISLSLSLSLPVLIQESHSRSSIIVPAICLLFPVLCLPLLLQYFLLLWILSKCPSILYRLHFPPFCVSSFMKLRCAFHTPSLMSSDRMKPRSGDWVVTIDFLQEPAVASLSSVSSVNYEPWSNIQVPGMWMFHVGLTGRGGNVAPPDLDGTSENWVIATWESPCSGFCLHNAYLLSDVTLSVPLSSHCPYLCPHIVRTSVLTLSVPLSSHCPYLCPHTVRTSVLTLSVPLSSHCPYLCPHIVRTSVLTLSVPLSSHCPYLCPHIVRTCVLTLSVPLSSHCLYLCPHIVCTSVLTLSVPLSSHCPYLCEAGKTDSCTLGKTLCHSKSHCVDHVTGFCCHCHSGYYGNGFNCLKEGIPLRVNGKVSGIVNGQEFSQLDLQSYVVTSDGRTYTAISRVQSTIGYDMQTLNVLGGVIGWLFARPLNKASNGYALTGGWYALTGASFRRVLQRSQVRPLGGCYVLTGGVFNHTAEISFPLTGNDVVVRQRYLGLDVFDQLKMEAEIQGSLPTIPVGTKIQIPDYEEQYTRTEPGVMVAKSSLIYRLDGVPVDNPFTVEQTVRFSECPHAPLNVSTVRLKVARNFISYEGRENIIRYAMTDKVTLSSDFDPCKEGRSKCGEHSFCRVEGNSFSCACNQGFQHLYSESDGVGSEICVDINECQTGAHDCDVNALCINEEGSYACQCVSGFVGNGQSCQKLETCEDLNCHPDAECVQVTETALQCQCLAGFTGDGVNCVPSIGRESCDQANDCSVYGACTLDATSDKYVCVCLPGYLGDGYYCVDSELHSNYTGSGVPVPTCVLGICWCPEGYDLEGQNSCAKKSDYDDLVTDTDDTEDSLILSRPEPACYNSTLCFCPTGYTYEPLTGTCDLPPGADSHSHGTMGPTGHKPSCNIVNTCHPHAQCVLITQDNKYRCQCDAGYEGDGYECGEIGGCNFWSWVLASDHVRVGGVNEVWADKGIIVDSELLEVRRGDLPLWGNVIPCVPDVSCEEVDICDIHATCTYDELREKAVCLCNPGYQGDGILCSVAETRPRSLSRCLDPCPKWALGGRLTCSHTERVVCVFVDECSGPEDCGGNAKCDWSRERQHYACLCVEGHVREGAVCVPEQGE